MRFWGYLAAKLAVGGGVAWSIGWAINRWYPTPAPFMRNIRQDPFAHDLAYTLVMLGYFLLCLGLFYLILRDQRLRCRICLRRLRMPVATGSWTHVLLGPPTIEYICPYGHGTLKVPELQIGGPEAPDWQAHEDIWKELFSETKR